MITKDHEPEGEGEGETDGETDGETEGGYGPGKKVISGVYKSPNPPPYYIITDVHYETAALIAYEDGTQQMSDKWVQTRLWYKVGETEVRKIEQFMNQGNVEKWLITVLEDGSSTAQKIGDRLKGDDGYVIQGDAGKVPDYP